MEEFELSDLPSPTLEQLQALVTIRSRDFVKHLEAHPTASGEYVISWQELNLESLEEEHREVRVGLKGEIVNSSRPGW